MSSAPQPLPPQLAVLQILFGQWQSMALSAAAKLGIADHLKEGPKTAAEIAPLVNANPDALYRLMRANAAVGIFRELPDGRFEQTPMSATLATGAKPGVRNICMMLLDDWHHGAWGEIAWSVETGKPATLKTLGMPLFEFVSRHADRAVNFNNAMTDFSLDQAKAVVDAYDFSRFEHIVDVAGGHGLLLSLILETAPKLKGTLFEMPYVIEQAKASAILASYADRCDFAAGSFFESVAGDADCYIMKFIIHDWYDPEASKILQNCRKGIRQGGKLLVIDAVVPPLNQPDLSKLLDIEMLVLPGGKERTEEEFRNLFAVSGFRLDRVIPTKSNLSIVEGSPV